MHTRTRASCTCMKSGGPVYTRAPLPRYLHARDDQIKRMHVQARLFYMSSARARASAFSHATGARPHAAQNYRWYELKQVYPSLLVLRSAPHAHSARAHPHTVGESDDPTGCTVDDSDWSTYDDGAGNTYDCSALSDPSNSGYCSQYGDDSNQVSVDGFTACCLSCTSGTRV